jgi:hypothetical protein
MDISFPLLNQSAMNEQLAVIERLLLKGCKKDGVDIHNENQFLVFL